jgi:single-stranded DNA-binding protein
MISEIVTINHDARMRYIKDDQPFLKFSGTYDYKEDGKTQKQRLVCHAFGLFAEAISEFIIKGDAIFIQGDDLHISKFTKTDGSMVCSLNTTLTSVELISREDSTMLCFSAAQYKKPLPE